MEVFEYPDKVKLMSTTARHSMLVVAFAGEMRGRVKSGELECYAETVALVYDEDQKLINVNEITRKEEDALSRQLTKMRFVEPDILIFKENVHIMNFQRTRIAGVPDLVIEVWSEDNNEEHRQRKFEIYGSSELTEHWYVDQLSDIIRCYKGKKRLPDQHLKNILKTQCGLEFDLSDKQTFDDTSWNEFVAYGFKGE